MSIQIDIGIFIVLKWSFVIKRKNQSVEEQTIGWFDVGIQGLEPWITGPESVVLPITPYPKIGYLLKAVQS